MLRSILIFSVLTAVAQCESVKEWDVKYFEQPVDHFNFEDTRTFLERYLINDTFWGGGDSPIFFYTGNEAPIVTKVLSANTGLQVALAPLYNALLISAEHRYYGDSKPFGNQSFERENVGYLQVEQALADYARLVIAIKEQYNAPNSRVISFGGSYGALLSSWFRQSYPDVVYGAVASAAPSNFNSFPTGEAWYTGVSLSFLEYDKKCANQITNMFNTLKSDITEPSTRAKLQAELNLCTPVASIADGVQLASWSRQAFSSLAQFNYPYPLLADVGWPMYQFCNATTAYPNVYDEWKIAMNLWYNTSSNRQSCFNYTDMQIEATTTIEEIPWNYQCCTEIVFPIGSTGKYDIFDLYLPYNAEALSQYCQLLWGVTPNANHTILQYGGVKERDVTRVIFVNGQYDPTRMYAGFYTHDAERDISVLNIGRAGHCYDLYPPNPADTPEVQAARQKENDIIGQWLSNSP